MPLKRSGSRNADGDKAGLPSYYASSQGHAQSPRDSSAVVRSKTRAGPNRSTKASGKLKILPEEPEEGTIQGHAPSTTANTNKVRGRLPGEDETTSHERIGEDDEEEDSSDEEDDEDIHGEARDEQRAKLSKQLELARIPEGSMRRDARRITRKGRATLPRVTAYSTATSYRMRELTRWLQARRETHRTNAMTFDECVYSTYSYDLFDQARGLQSNTHHVNDGHQSAVHADFNRTGTSTKFGDLLGVPELRQGESDDAEAGRGNALANVEDGANTDSTNKGDIERSPEQNIIDLKGQARASLLDETVEREEAIPPEAWKQREALKQSQREEAKRRRRERFAVHGIVPEVFFMEYGTVVIWGMTLTEEKRLLRELRRFEVEKLAPEDVESEDLNWYLADYSRIYNDVITLRKGSSYMTKLSLSHALAQSTKISFFEGVIDNTIDTTKDIPQSIAESGKIGLPPVDIMKQIGHLFILRMNIHLVGSIVDSPEIFWAQPDLEPLYSAARSYLEIPQRIELLNARVEVLQDMLQLLKDQVTSSHSEWLEIIVIILILLEIILGVATMVVDLYFA